MATDQSVKGQEAWDAAFHAVEELQGFVAKKPFHLVIGFDRQMKEKIERLSERTGYEAGELVDIAVALLTLSLDAVEEGRQVGVAADGQELERNFTGFHKNDPAVAQIAQD